MKYIPEPSVSSQEENAVEALKTILTKENKIRVDKLNETFRDYVGHSLKKYLKHDNDSIRELIKRHSAYFSFDADNNVSLSEKIKEEEIKVDYVSLLDKDLNENLPDFNCSAIGIVDLVDINETGPSYQLDLEENLTNHNEKNQMKKETNKDQIEKDDAEIENFKLNYDEYI